MIPKIPTHTVPLASAECERIAQATARVLSADGKAAASAYIYAALECAGLFDMAHPQRSKIKRWEVQVLADRALFLAGGMGHA